MLQGDSSSGTSAGTFATWSMVPLMKPGLRLRPISCGLQPRQPAVGAQQSGSQPSGAAPSMRDIHWQETIHMACTPAAATDRRAATLEWLRI